MEASSEIDFSFEPLNIPDSPDSPDSLDSPDDPDSPDSLNSRNWAEAERQRELRDRQPRRARQAHPSPRLAAVILRRVAFLEFRVRAQKLPVHERYKPLVPSPLRNEITWSSLMDPDLSDAETIADSPSSSSSFFSGSDLSSSSESASTSVKSNDSDCQQDTTE
ncbi:hypothetical protein C8A00DRAFT_30466 [Chaetomidium leptoderma]|uniref:Uncharacterized protein n=1 Tax=Chaetomidium leptoderma TaxID=669021 RepID=A0AAN6VRS9_9PEZI|nr:hypothetical protein C8A00DRAFT_30466 [Chaetomidium leptoderma]